MAAILEKCELEIVAQIEKLDQFRQALNDALTAIKKVREQQLILPTVGNTNELIAQLISGNLTDSLTAISLPADVTKETAVKPQATITDVQNSHISDVVDNSPTNEDNELSSKEKPEGDQLLEHLLRVAGAKKGVKYKIEVTSPLNPDGTFWACHVESGFIHSKLQPLSERLRLATQNDKSLWKVDDLSAMVCTKSIDNGLWMRGIIVRMINEQTIRVRFIDVGRTEDCQFSRICKVPEILSSIPFMSFNCTLFRHVANLGYDAKWRFSDLSKKKVLNFTVEDMFERDNLTFLYGKLETILDEPIMNITEEIAKYDKGGADKQENRSIVSRDIRTNNISNSEDFTSVNEVICKSPKKEVQNFTNETKNILETKEKVKEGPKLPPIEIPVTSPSGKSWGETKTPGAEELEFDLLPLDEKFFDQNNSVDETEKPSGEKLMQPMEQERAHMSMENIFLQQQELAKNKQLWSQWQGDLMTLLKQENELLQTPQLLQEHPDALNVLRRNIQLLQQQIQSLQQFIFQTEQTSQSSFPLPPLTHQMSPSPISKPQMPIGSPPATGRPEMPISFLPGAGKPCIPMNSPPANLMPIGTRPPIYNAEPRTNSIAIYCCDNAPQETDYNAKLKQLDAITRSLRMPSDLLDDDQMQHLQKAKYFLERQLYEEETRKQQMEAMIRQSNMMNSQPATIENQAIPKHHVTSDYFNPRFSMNQRLVSQGVEQPRQQEQPVHPVNHKNIPSELGLLDYQTETVLPVKYSGISNLVHTSQVLNQNVLIDPNIISEETSGNQNTATNETSKSVEDAEEKPPNSIASEEKHSHIIQSQVNAPINKTQGTYNSSQDLKKFEVVQFQTFFSELKNDWISRELLNLTHPYLENDKARFYTVVHCETKPGIFTPKLDRVYSNGFYWFLHNDAQVFQREWEKNDGPIFLIIKHKPYVSRDNWKVGGICQIMSKIRNVNTKSYGTNAQAHIKFISTAIIEDNHMLRSDKQTHEIAPDLSKKLIRSIISSVQTGTAENLFHYIKKVKANESAYMLDSNLSNSGNSIPTVFATQSTNVYSALQNKEEENWEIDEKVVESNDLTKAMSSDDFGSGDEGERNLNAEIEAFGLNEEDLSS